MPKLKIRLKLSKILFKPKTLLGKISKALSGNISQEMSTSRASNRRMTMAELLEEEKTQLQHIYYKSLSLKDMIETRDIEEGEDITVKPSKKKCRESPAGKRSSSTVSLSLSNFLRKKTRFRFTKWRINKKKNVNVDDNIGIVGNVGDDLSRKKEEDSMGRSFTGRKNAIGKKEMQCEKEVEQGEDRGGEEEESGGEFELCKRRILMGGKCKPLNVSGTLRYDESGILLPEEILAKEG